MKDTLLFAFAAMQAVGALVALLAWFGIGPSAFRHGASMPRDAIFWVGLLLIVGSLATSGVGLYRSRQLRPAYQKDVVFTLVADRTFMNERVEIDGKEFRNCVFENATLVYNGRYPVRMNVVTLRGHTVFASENASVEAAMDLLSQLGLMPGVARHTPGVTETK